MGDMHVDGSKIPTVMSFCYRRCSLLGGTCEADKAVILVPNKMHHDDFINLVEGVVLMLSW